MYHQQEALTSDVVYAGSINDERGKFWNVRIQKGMIELHRKWYLMRKFGGRGPCYEMAKRIQKAVSDEYGLTLHRNHVPPHVIQYIAGFIDGDGNISGNKENSITVGATQSQEHGVPGVLKYIQNWYGGNISKPRRRAKTHRIVYDLEIRGPNAVWLLRDLEHTSIIKNCQVKMALRILRLDRADRRPLIKQLKAMKTKSSMQQVQIEATDAKLTWPYISGFFDAEGSVGYKDGITLVLAQLSNLNILYAIREKLNMQCKGVHEKGGVLRVSSEKAVQMAKRMLPYSIVKQEQMQYAMFIRVIRRREIIDRSTAAEMAKKLKQMKKI